MEKEHRKERSEEDQRRRSAKGEYGCESHCDGKKGPPKVLHAFCREPCEEGVGFWEVRVEPDAAHSMSVGRSKALLLACKLGHAASTFSVGHHTGVNRGLAYKGITAVYRLRVWRVICRPSYDQWLVIYFLVTYSMGVANMDTRTVCGTPKGESGIVKRTTAIAVEVAVITCRPITISMLSCSRGRLLPEVCSAPDWIRLSVTFDVAC